LTGLDPTVIQRAYGITPKNMYALARLRICARGEYQTNELKCIICPDGFYTLYENMTSCSPCPQNAVCENGYEIKVDQGYWRNSTQSTDIYECYNVDACVGGYESECAAGYGGNLCHSCVQYEGKWYSREVSHECSKCPSYQWNSIRLCLVILLLAVYVVILVIVNIRNEDGRSLTSVYMRILTNYFQILTLSISYDLNWQSDVKQLLQSVAFVGKTSELVLSIDCFLKESKNLFI